MGNCCSSPRAKGTSAHTQPQPVNVREQQLVSKAHPEETDLSLLSRYLTDKRDLARLAKVKEYMSEGYSIVDGIILLLSDPTLPEPTRQGLLILLTNIVRTPEGFHMFNLNALINNIYYNRIDRLKVILLEENEELPEGRNLLLYLNYFSLLFEKIRERWAIQYTIILDKSGSMSTKDGDNTRWEESDEAIEHMTEQLQDICPQGLTLYMFSSRSNHHPKYVELKTSEQVEAIFHNSSPGGGTDLAGVLRQAFNDHFNNPMRGREHWLVITDGEPDNKDEVVSEIVAGTNRLSEIHELGITFMQVGSNLGAADFLHTLQDCITEKGAKWNIVDCITHVDYDGQDLCDVITKHLPEKHHAKPSIHHPLPLPPPTVNTPLLPPVSNYVPNYVPAGPQSNLAFNPSYNSVK